MPRKSKAISGHEKPLFLVAEVVGKTQGGVINDEDGANTSFHHKLYLHLAGYI
jgi:hypothetical protein